jgi:transposase
MAIWQLCRSRNSCQDLVSESGFRGGYQTVKRFVRKLRGSEPVQPRAVIVTAPGEAAQVDYGTGPMVRDPQTGKYRRTRLFVLTLGYSQKAVRLLTFRSSSRIWAELHEKAFRRLGGSSRVVVLDNLRHREAIILLLKNPSATRHEEFIQPSLRLARTHPLPVHLPQKHPPLS